MASGNVYGREGFSVPRSRIIEAIRSISATEEVVAPFCTIYSVQAVAGVATAGCARAGVDYGRRQ